MKHKSTDTYNPATEYEKRLRKYTIRDTIKTLIIITALFIVQAVVFYGYQQDMLSGLLP